MQLAIYYRFSHEINDNVDVVLVAASIHALHVNHKKMSAGRTRNGHQHSWRVWDTSFEPTSSYAYKIITRNP